MPPTFRSSRSGRQLGDGLNRTRTGQIDHDVTEGLPVRRWTRQPQTVSQEPKTEGAESEAPGQGGKQSVPDHPMPRDSHLLTPMSRALLKAARAGCIYIRPASKEFEDEEKEATDPEEQQTQQNLERNFSMRKWTTVPRHLEAPEVEFLAKRRPGLPSIYAAPAAGVDGAHGLGSMRKTRFKKVDPVTGNISVYAAWVPEGHKIEGEVLDEAQLIAENSKVAVIPEAPAPGTIIEGVGVVNAQGVVVAEAGSAAVLTPPRRRPPPPKRKGKSLKGRKKKVMFAPGEGADASLVHGTVTVPSKETDPSRMSMDQTTQDDEDDEGEEGEESDDGEGDESGLDAKTPEPHASAEPEPGPKSGPTTEPSAAVETEPRTESQALQVPNLEPTLKTSLATTEIPGNVLANMTGSPSQQAPAEAGTTALHISNDVQMTDAGPKVSSPEKDLYPRGLQQPAAPHPSLAIAELTDQQIAESTDTIMAEPDVPINKHSRDLPPQTSVSVQTPTDESVPKLSEQQPNGNEFDLLDNLEASLAGIPDDSLQSDIQSGQPEVTAAVGLAAEAPAEIKSAESAGDTRNEPTAPPVEELTPPEPEKATIQETTNNEPADQVPQPTDLQKTEQVSEALAPSGPSKPDLEAESAQYAEEHPQQSPQQIIAADSSAVSQSLSLGSVLEAPREESEAESKGTSETAAEATAASVTDSALEQPPTEEPSELEQNALSLSSMPSIAGSESGVATTNAAPGDAPASHSEPRS
ncbi:hypothetical protein BJY04DRAFT_158529 [Aspergillus karnatakaensis]|uniref:uncharacterized protein n=1 Tax=Aspergillus karnatakaensis TaxID=1810916 RepID=UPI003CCD367D